MKATYFAIPIIMRSPKIYTKAFKESEAEGLIVKFEQSRKKVESWNDL